MMASELINILQEAITESGDQPIILQWPGKQWWRSLPGDVEVFADTVGICTSKRRIVIRPKVDEGIRVP